MREFTNFLGRVNRYQNSTTDLWAMKELLEIRTLLQRDLTAIMLGVEETLGQLERTIPEEHKQMFRDMYDYQFPEDLDNVPELYSEREPNDE